MKKTIRTNRLAVPGWAIYHSDDACFPGAHKVKGWYFEPAPNLTTGEVFSEGYATERQAIAACRKWVRCESS